MNSKIPEKDLRGFLDVAIQAAKTGGLVLNRYWRDGIQLDVDEKGINDFVTQVDRDSEREIVSFIRSHFSDHDIVAEEFSKDKAGSRYLWLIDPLDGTTNYIHRFPMFCVSIALLIDGDISVGAVYDPVRDETFQAIKGKGAFLNGKKIAVTRKKSLAGCLLATGFPFKQQPRIKQYLKSFETFMKLSAGVRRAGSAALDLCYTAAGIFDGFWEMGLSPWDIAAGALFIHEAGGVASDFQGGDKFLETGDIVAASAAVHKEMHDIIKKSFPAD
jgi:myo-inositol-1(or 4)-monophosphatase